MMEMYNDDQEKKKRKYRKTTRNGSEKRKGGSGLGDIQILGHPKRHGDTIKKPDYNKENIKNIRRPTYMRAM